MTISLAAVFDGTAGQMKLRQLPTPAPHDGETLVRVLGCTICGSDLHTFEGRRRVPFPTVLGHEIVGEIVEFGGEEVLDLAGRVLHRGDRVTWAIVASCGSCDLCLRGLPQKCRYAVKYGHEAFQPSRELLGGLAEHCLLVPGSAVVYVPDDLPLSVACPASCATATVAAALEAAGELQNRSVCLLGSGLLGLTAAAMARSFGAAEVVCIDPIPSRRELAMKFGATRAASPEELAVVADKAAGTLGFDAVLELSGSPAAFHAAWPRIRLGGTLVLIGSVFPSEPVPVALEQIVRRQLTIRGIHNYAPRHLLSAIEFLAAHHCHYPFADLVREWYPLSQIQSAFERGLQPDAIRIGVHPTSAARI